MVRQCEPPHRDVTPIGNSLEEKLVVETPLYFTAPHHDCIIAIKQRLFAESSKLPLCPLLPFSRFPICMMSFVMPGFFAYKEAAEKLNYDLFSFKEEN